MMFDIVNNVAKGYQKWLGITGASNIQAIANAIDQSWEQFHFNKEINKNNVHVYFCTSAYLVHKYKRNLLNTDNELKIKIVVVGQPQNLIPKKVEKAIDKEIVIFRNLMLNYNIEIGVDDAGDIGISSMSDLERMSYQPNSRKLNPDLKELIIKSMANKKVSDDLIHLIEKYAENNIDPFFIQDYLDSFVSDKKLTKKKINQILEKLS